MKRETCERIRRAYLKKYPELKVTLGQLFDGVALGDSTLAEDLHEITARNIDATTKAALVSARIGQGRFRADVLRLWGNRCAVTRSVTQKAIRASHITPWRESTDEERLDPYNGLPLLANLDALFDAGLISFDPSGKMLISSQLTAAERGIFGLVGGAASQKKPSVKNSVVSDVSPRQAASRNEACHLPSCESKPSKHLRPRLLLHVREQAPAVPSGPPMRTARGLRGHACVGLHDGPGGDQVARARLEERDDVLEQPPPVFQRVANGPGWLTVKFHQHRADGLDQVRV